VKATGEYVSMLPFNIITIQTWYIYTNVTALKCIKFFLSSLELCKPNGSISAWGYNSRRKQYS